MKENTPSLPQASSNANSFLYLLGVIFLQTLLSVLPGILLYHQDSGKNWQGALLLIGYLLVTNFSEMAVRTQYRKQKRFPAAAYAIKILICSVLIILFASQTHWQFALMLFAYELFQTLANSRQYFYLDSPYYTLLNPFFKGFVLNLLFLMKPPLYFQSKQFQALVPAFLMALTLTVFQQAHVSQINRKKIFIAAFLLASLLNIGSLIYFSGELFAFWQVIVAIVGVLVGTYFAFRQRHFLKAEAVLNFCYLIIIFLLYF